MTAAPRGRATEGGGGCHDRSCWQSMTMSGSPARSQTISAGASAKTFRVIGEPSASAGLAILRDLAGSGGPVALLIADHDMAEMSGVDFLARAHEMHPLAKRVLLVERDYSADSPVVQAMTLGQADLSRTLRRTAWSSHPRRAT